MWQRVLCLLAAGAVAFGPPAVGGVGAHPKSAASPVEETHDRFSLPATDDGLPGAGPLRRYDWFQRLWRERRSTWAGQVGQDRNAVVATLGFPQTEDEPFAPEEGFESLFNGRNLSGWGYLPTSEADKENARRWQASDPDAAAWPFVTEAVLFDGLTASPDGRFVAMGGRLVVKTPPEYRKIQQLWTTREFPSDFVLKLEFRATPNADSGIYLRGPQLQCRDYRLAGPYRHLKKYRPQDWNEIEVTVTGRTARATCNGEVLEEALPLPDSGPIGLEGDRGQMEYRRIRIRALPR